MNKKNIKVMIVDDHPMVRQGLAMFVSGCEDMQLVAEATNEASAIELYHEFLPDIVLMDMVIPDTDGATIIRKIRQGNPEAAIIALTSYGDEHIIESALRAGARGFLYKDISVDELANAIRQTYEGRTILDQKASDVMLRMVNSPTAPYFKSELSEREADVLELLVLGLTNKQIAYRLNLQISTVKQYISNILSKLNVRSRTEAVATAIKLGIVKQ